MDSLGEMSVRPADLDALIARINKAVAGRVLGSLVRHLPPYGAFACRGSGPSIGDAVEVVTLNVEEGQDAAQAHNVLSLPTVIAFRGGSEVKRINGMISYANLGRGDARAYRANEITRQTSRRKPMTRVTLSNIDADPYYRMLGNRPEILAAWGGLDKAMLGPSSKVSVDIKEEGAPRARPECRLRLLRDGWRKALGQLIPTRK